MPLTIEAAEADVWKAEGFGCLHARELVPSRSGNKTCNDHGVPKTLQTMKDPKLPDMDIATVTCMPLQSTARFISKPLKTGRPLRLRGCLKGAGAAVTKASWRRKIFQFCRVCAFARVLGSWAFRNTAAYRVLAKVDGDLF